MDYSNNKIINHRLTDTDLSNWRLRPYNKWSFQNVRELIPTANISATVNGQGLNREGNSGPTGFDQDKYIATLEKFQTDSVVILHNGRKAWQWNADYCDPQKPHIAFSISKSITAMMTGCLVGQGLLDVTRVVSHYLPEVKGSGYEDCTLQQLLDMTVALNFEEEYLTQDGDYFRYRNSTGWNPVDQTNDIVTMEPFICRLGRSESPHGEVFSYKSPNSDLLGLLLQRVSGIPYADLLGQLIWQPMGAVDDGYVTVDFAGLARGAGGICVTIDELARFGQLILDKGTLDGKSVIPEHWIHDTLTNGNRQAWVKGGFIDLLPLGKYRNKWYQVGDADGCFMGLGIHGQWLFINPAKSVVIAKFSSQELPLDDIADAANLNLLLEISKSF